MHKGFYSAILVVCVIGILFNTYSLLNTFTVHNSMSLILFILGSIMSICGLKGD